MTTSVILAMLVPTGYTFMTPSTPPRSPDPHSAAGYVNNSATISTIISATLVPPEYVFKTGDYRVQMTTKYMEAGTPAKRRQIHSLWRFERSKLRTILSINATQYSDRNDTYAIRIRRLLTKLTMRYRAAARYKSPRPHQTINAFGHGERPLIRTSSTLHSVPRCHDATCDQPHRSKNGHRRVAPRLKRHTRCKRTGLTSAFNDLRWVPDDNPSTTDPPTVPSGPLHRPPATREPQGSPTSTGMGTPTAQAYRPDFAELFAGDAVLTSAANDMLMSTAPPTDIKLGLQRTAADDDTINDQNLHETSVRRRIFGALHKRPPKVLFKP